ncbi:hypothetical protein BJY00DRAFT_323342 [Aspergillus carlsbadensis]|nr:hypothetical protein BJY00DRAFT_323342 [Aspergillus carlsbadensis]
MKILPHYVARPGISMDSAPHQQPILALTEPEQAPRLTVSLNGWKKLSAKVANWPSNAITITIKREPDGSDRPCVFRWDPASAPLILRRLSNNGEMQEAPVTAPTPQGPTPEHDSPLGPFSANNKDTIELWPAAEIAIYATLPERYGPLLDVGGLYEVVLAWGGCDIAHWAWGTTLDHLVQGQHLLALEPPVARIPLTLTVSPGARFSFTALTPHWRPELAHQNKAPRPPLIDPSARLPGAPVLTITLSVDDGKITGREWDVELKLMTKVTYHGVLGNPTPGPIIFFANATILYESHFLLDRRRGEASWEHCQPVFPCGAGVYPIDVPRGFTHAHPSSFVNLHPGESWEAIMEACDGDPWEFPPDVAIGDIFRLQHRGCVVGWWNWGGPEDLAAALASFPSINKTLVAYPKDIEGRPKLVVPASDAIELVYEE